MTEIGNQIEAGTRKAPAACAGPTLFVYVVIYRNTLYKHQSDWSRQYLCLSAPQSIIRTIYLRSQSWLCYIHIVNTAIVSSQFEHGDKAILPKAEE